MLARDQDMTTCLDGRPDGMGFMGTDIWGELPYSERQKCWFLQVAETSLRLAFLTTEEKIKPFKTKIGTREPASVLIATTYPEGARIALNSLTLAIPWRRPQVEIMNINGSIEGAPKMFPGVDAVYDIIDSGQTAEDNGLRVVYDNQAQVSLGAVVLDERP